MKVVARVFLGLLLAAGTSHAVREPDPDGRGSPAPLDPRPEFPEAQTGAFRVFWKDYRQIPLAADPGSLESIQRALEDWVDRHPSRLGSLGLDDLDVVSSKRVEGKGTAATTFYVNFRQQLDGLPVEGTYLNFTVKALQGGPAVVSILCQLYPHLYLGTERGWGLQELESRVRRRLGINEQASAAVQKRTIRYLGKAWRAVVEMKFQGSPFWAASDLSTGETFAWDGRVYADLEGQVSGRAVVFDPVGTGPELSRVPLADLLVRVGLKDVAYTDAQGGFSAPHSGSESVPVRAGLEGRWAAVETRSGERLSFSGALSPGRALPIVFNSSGSAENPTAQVNGYYHTHRAHEWLRSKGVQAPGMDVPLPVNVNIRKACNAFFDGASINFYMARSRGKYNCINTAYDTVVYHEYGHFADDAIGGIASGGLSEGWGDVIGMYMTGQPLVGEGFFGGEETYIRTGANSYRYAPVDLPHRQGQAWMGFGWKLRENLIQALGPAAGAAMAEALVIPVLLNDSPDIPDAVKQVALRDMDADGKMPHLREIRAAAEVHGLEEFVPTPPGMARIVDGMADFSSRVARTAKRLWVRWLNS